jgi:hypothetical protein
LIIQIAAGVALGEMSVIIFGRFLEKSMDALENYLMSCERYQDELESLLEKCLDRANLIKDKDTHFRALEHLNTILNLDELKKAEKRINEIIKKENE